ncbi:MAG TPA: hypothetical protein VK206_03035 [Anaerolineales bacterium]|nr:hypothetical protein [Anaerolineales bacterium]HLO30546.1 hypothetical protein [Anaerolineales bacterium]
MEHFDDVVTDPSIRKADVSSHIADLRNIGKPFMAKYTVWTTSGTTGTPGIFLEDKNWDAVITAVNVLRMGGEWYTMDVIRGMMQAGGNSASVFAGNGHFLGVTMLERQRNSNHARRKHIRLIPVTLPIQEIVKQLNDLQPAMLAGYASALGRKLGHMLRTRIGSFLSLSMKNTKPFWLDNSLIVCLSLIWQIVSCRSSVTYWEIALVSQTKYAPAELLCPSLMSKVVRMKSCASRPVTDNRFLSCRWHYGLYLKKLLTF